MHSSCQLVQLLMVNQLVKIACKLILYLSVLQQNISRLYIGPPTCSFSPVPSSPPPDGDVTVFWSTPSCSRGVPSSFTVTGLPNGVIVSNRMSRSFTAPPTEEDYVITVTLTNDCGAGSSGDVTISNFYTAKSICLFNLNN